MTRTEALSNIGQQFKVAAFTSGLLAAYDTILSVDGDGIITGEFLQAHCSDCRFKEQQPQRLKDFQEKRKAQKQHSLTQNKQA